MTTNTEPDMPLYVLVARALDSDPWHHLLGRVKPAEYRAHRVNPGTHDGYFRVDGIDVPAACCIVAVRRTGAETPCRERTTW